MSDGTNSNQDRILFTKLKFWKRLTCISFLLLVIPLVVEATVFVMLHEVDDIETEVGNSLDLFVFAVKAVIFNLALLLLIISLLQYFRYSGLIAKKIQPM